MPITLRGCLLLLWAAAAVWGGVPENATSATVATDSARRAADFSPSATYEYRAGPPQPVQLHVFYPEGWSARDRRPVLLFFFGGSWLRGAPQSCIQWAHFATQLGLVGILPDYRTRERFGTTPLDTVADARAALRWVQEHAGELGADAGRIVAAGSSAGGHLALWTALRRTPPGADPREAPLAPPAALLLLCPSPDTTDGHRVERFGAQAEAVSAYHQMETGMPPTLMFHGDADRTVPYRIAIAFQVRMTAMGNACDLVTVPGGKHSFLADLPEWRERVYARARTFFAAHGLTVAAEKAGSEPPPARPAAR
ncbi:MAG: alpha/beta hydrolase [Opitutae bacterium]|nr:alpha/beta hydrolase [Opitutae bacterium]